MRACGVGTRWLARCLNRKQIYTIYLNAAEGVAEVNADDAAYYTCPSLNHDMISILAVSLLHKRTTIELQPF